MPGRRKSRIKSLVLILMPTLALAAPAIPVPVASSSAPTAPASTPGPPERPVPQIGCTNPINSTQTWHAATDLGKYCAVAGEITRNTKVSWRVGGSRAYCCNYSWVGRNPCGPAEIRQAWEDTRRQCGVGVGGWWYEPGWKKTYGFDTADAPWCANL